MKRRIDDDTLVLFEGEKPELYMQEISEDDYVLVCLEGTLKSVFAHDFEDELQSIAIVGMPIILDFEKVTFLSSACSQVLLNIQKRIDEKGKGSLTIRKIPEKILKDLQSTGMSELLMIE